MSLFEAVTLLSCELAPRGVRESYFDKSRMQISLNRVFSWSFLCICRAISLQTQTQGKIDAALTGSKKQFWKKGITCGGK